MFLCGGHKEKVSEMSVPKVPGRGDKSLVGNIGGGQEKEEVNDEEVGEVFAWASPPANQ